MKSLKGKLINHENGVLSLKKTCAFSFLLLVSTGLFAQGFYAGLSGGYQSLVNAQGGLNNQFSTSDSNNSYFLYNEFTANTTVDGIIGSVFLGYERTFLSHLLLGVEFNAEVMDNKNTQASSAQLAFNELPRISVSGGLTKTTEHLALGITVRPGLLFKNNARIYGILGYEAAQFTVSDFFVLQLIDSSNAFKATTGNKWLNGFRYGLGTQFDVNEWLALRLEFNQTQYPEASTGDYYNLATDMPVPSNLSFKFKTTSTSLGLVYKFDHVKAV